MSYPSTESPNGDLPDLELADDDAVFIGAARKRLTAATKRRNDAAAELAQAAEVVKRWERVVRFLDPETEPATPAPSKPRSKRPASTRIGDDRLAQIEAAFRELAGADGRAEVRVKELMERLADEGHPLSSGPASVAFQVLRERQVIRLARKEGNSRYYRLTRAAASQS